jgi:hypothetical protein
MAQSRELLSFEALDEKLEHRLSNIGRHVPFHSRSRPGKFVAPVSEDELRDLHARYERWLEMVFTELRDVRGLLRDVQSRQKADRFERDGIKRYSDLLAREGAALRREPHHGSINNTQIQILTFLLSKVPQRGWPALKVEAIGAAAGVKVRAARVAIRDLEERGLLKRVKSDGGISTFDLSGLYTELDRLAHDEEPVPAVASVTLETLQVHAGRVTSVRFA